MSFYCATDGAKFRCAETRRVDSFIHRRYVCPECRVMLRTEERIVEAYQGGAKKVGPPFKIKKEEL